MPIYDFECTNPDCGKTFDQIVPSVLVTTTCPKCGKAANKIMSAPNFHLKGGGWGDDGYSKKSTGLDNPPK